MYFKTLLRKKYGSDENFDVIVNAEKGDLEIIRRRMIVEDGAGRRSTGSRLLIAMPLKLNLILKWVKNCMRKSIFYDFGRRAILAAKQTLASRISDLKKNVLVKKYGERIGEIISAEVYQVWKKEILLLDEEGNELILPKSRTNTTGLFQEREKHPCCCEESGYEK